MSPNEADKLENRFLISNRRNDSGGVILKIVSTQRPTPTANQVPPTLEDLYLYYFREGGQDYDETNTI